ncbi:MAG: TonB family protein [Paludibacteraceae bacterium]|nr:TonB family protein [Paludibacteraceae bacterium]
MQLKKSEIQSGVATTIICIIILLILLFCGMTVHKDEMDEGVMISLGYAEEGFGESVPNPTPTPAPEAAPVPTPTPPPAAPEVSTPSEEDLMTQEDPSVALEAEKKRKQAEEEAKRRAEEERIAHEKAEQERIAREKAAEEARIKAEQEAKKNQASSLAGSAFQNMGKGQGQTKGEAQQGNPAGQGSQGGHSWSLNGRNLLGKLAQPSYQSNEEGRIVVEIRVDASGNVISAAIHKYTTITNETLRNAAVEAAKKNKFSTGGGVAIGTITYNFRLN